MAELLKILEHLRYGTRVPDELLADMSPAESSSLRALEQSIKANRGWRSMSVKLLDAAHMLNSGQASAKIFDQIVYQARTILGTDVGYISLNDEDSGKTNILATSGVITDEFRTIRMPMGTGVLGLVAATHSPAWTFDHATDPKVSHVDYVDAAVRAEGIHGILGAPIAKDGTTIGALLVADRQPRSFTADEVTALSLLASIAAAALNTAQVIESQHLAMAELTSTRDEIHEHVVELQHVADADSQLLGLMSGAATLEDLQGFLAAHVHPQVQLVHPDAPATSDAPVVSTAPTDPARTHFPVEFNGRQLGAIVTPSGRSAAEMRIIAHGCAAFAAISLFNEALSAATSRKVDDLVYAAAIRTLGTQEVSRLRQLTGVDVRKTQNLYFVGVHTGKRGLRRSVLERLLDFPAAVTAHEDHLCIVAQPTQDIELALAPLLHQVEGIFVSCMAVDDAGSLGRAHDMAMDFLSAAVALGQHNVVVNEARLGSVGLILGASPQALEAMRSHSVRALTEYDAAHGTELELTAFKFLECGHSVPETAKSMYVHTNTIRQRIERITLLLGEGWDKGSRSLDIHLALKVRSFKK